MVFLAHLAPELPQKTSAFEAAALRGVSPPGAPLSSGVAGGRGSGARVLEPSHPILGPEENPKVLGEALVFMRLSEAFPLSRETEDLSLLLQTPVADHSKKQNEPKEAVARGRQIHAFEAAALRGVSPPGAPLSGVFG